MPVALRARVARPQHTVNSMAPEVCPNCGAEIPAHARACPECGSDEQTGWSEQAHTGGAGLREEDFDYAGFVPSMKNKKIQWGALALLTLIGLLFVLPPLPKSKARPQRIQTVNHVASVSITLPSTNALLTAPSNK